MRKSAVLPPLWQTTLLITGILLVIYILPLHVPVQKVVSVSYVVGYNNHAAILLTLCGLLLVALFTRGNLGRMDEQEGHLSRRNLWLALLIVGADCGFRLMLSAYGFIGGEAAFFLNRGQLLSAGRAPYTDFQFMYGPLLLYPQNWIAHIFGLPPIGAYLGLWYVQWLAGTWMLWFIVRSFNWPIALRKYFFWFVLLTLHFSIFLEGVNYTPVRLLAVLFLLILSWQIDKKTDALWLRVVTYSMSVAIALGISPEVGAGVLAGLGTGLLLDLIWKKKRFVECTVLAVMGTAVPLWAMSLLGMFHAMGAYSAGGFNFPLCFGPGSGLSLFAILITGAAAYRWFVVEQNDLMLRLMAAGICTLPAALGRSDFGHIQLLSPLYLIGVAVIFSRRRLALGWVPLALALILFPVSFASLREAHGNFSNLQAFIHGDTTRHFNIPAAPFTFNASALLCNEKYILVDVLPDYRKPIDLNCVVPGYYPGILLILTEQDISKKIDELKAAPNAPLLITDLPLDRVFADTETAPGILRSLQIAWIIPALKNEPMHYNRLRDFIQSNYVPGKVIGKYRIWEPMHSRPQ